MFPIPWNFPFRKKNGNVVNIQDAINSGGGGGGGSDLPDHGIGDAGKVLGVDNNGELEWSGIATAAMEVAQQTMSNLGDLSETVDDLGDDVSGLEEGLTNEVVTRGSLGAKNLLPNNATTQTINGVTFTVNSDGSVTANGTATEQALFMFNTKYKFPTGNFILSGGIRAGVFLFLNKHMGDTFIGNVVADGADTPFTIDYSNYDNFWYGVGVNEGLTVNNETFYPMIRLATDSDDTYQPYSMTNRELTPIAQAVSNRNLLDNPWFTVNQRGQSSYNTTNSYTVDRWKNNRLLVDVISNGLKFVWSQESNVFGYLQQFVENYADLVGKIVTLSYMYDDGTIVSKTGVFPNAGGTSINSGYDSNGFGILLEFSQNATYPNLQIRTNITTTNKVIKAVKLELGTVSTLHMDTAPNYAEELLKCQRYFQVIPETTAYRITAAANGSPFVVDTVLNLPVPMRDRPSIVDNGVELDIIALDQVGFAGTSKSIPSLPTGAPYSNIILRVGHSNPGQVSDGCILIYGKNLELSADL